MQSKAANYVRRGASIAKVINQKGNQAWLPNSTSKNLVLHTTISVSKVKTKPSLRYVNNAIRHDSLSDNHESVEINDEFVSFMLDNKFVPINQHLVVTECDGSACKHVVLYVMYGDRITKEQVMLAYTLNSFDDRKSENEDKAYNFFDRLNDSQNYNAQLCRDIIEYMNKRFSSKTHKICGDNLRMFFQLSLNKDQKAVKRIVNVIFDRIL